MTSAQRKAAMAGSSYTPSRFILHTDADDVPLPPPNEDGVVELPPQYSGSGKRLRPFLPVHHCLGQLMTLPYIQHHRSSLIHSLIIRIHDLFNLLCLAHIITYHAAIKTYLFV